ncbi:MAG TPA: hypothetical protein PK253_07605 [Spirochaetota bacterium]|nr:hypothetical protein [Spirochaetota bacterium]HPQ53103.1 hypothetical protein [Spirochaetota bacterium]
MKRRLPEKTCLIFFLAVIALLLPPAEAFAERISVIITSNLEGRTMLQGEDYDRNDELLLLGQSILYEKSRNRGDLYVDLGNAFYPGVLSKYSYGSVMMDFFGFFHCNGVLVSSKDLRIGVDNLKYLRKSRTTKLLSSNIVRNNKQVFDPFFIYQKGSQKTAFIGVSSKKIQFEIAEKNVHGTSLQDYRASLKESIAKAREQGAGSFVLMSGLTTRENITLMKEYPEIRIALCGGDHHGTMYGTRVKRLNLGDGRSIFFAPPGKGYYVLEFDPAREAGASRYMYYPSQYHRIGNGSYREFSNRLELWRRRYRSEGEKRIASVKGKEIPVDEERIAELLRDRYNAEVSLVQRGSVNRTVLKDDVSVYDLYEISNDEFPVFTCRIDGNDLRKVTENISDTVVKGVRDNKVQGVIVDDKRLYRIVSTQSVYEDVAHILRKRDLAYNNHWKSVTDTIREDMENGQALLSDDFGYLDRRFRGTIDVLLSNYLDYADVSRDEEISTPPGQPRSSYTQWGMENMIVCTVYNSLHQFILTPYMNYVELNEEQKDSDTGETSTRKFLVKNLLRGTFEYNLNLNSFVNPYHKSQCETVVKQNEDGLRPTIIRETVGARFKFSSSGGTVRFEGRLGGGFEKQVHDPEDVPLYGLETTILFKWDILQNLTYSFTMDSFFTKAKRDNDNVKGTSRVDLVNAITARINSYLGVSLKYKYFYYHTDELDESYRFRQFITSVDLKTDFKLW